MLDLELARIIPEVDPKSYLPAMDVAAELGARHVICSAWSTVRNDREFVVDTYSEICDLAQQFGLTVNLEFPSFSRLTDLQEAADIVRAANRPNGGILIDTLYFHLSRIKLDELTALPQEWLNFMHICDTGPEVANTREAMVHIARDERMYVGDGDIDFKAILERLPAMPYAIELPNIKRVQEYGYEEHARRCLETAKSHFENIEAGSALTETKKLQSA